MRSQCNEPSNNHRYQELQLKYENSSRVVDFSPKTQFKGLRGVNHSKKVHEISQSDFPLEGLCELGSFLFFAFIE